MTGFLLVLPVTLFFQISFPRHNHLSTVGVQSSWSFSVTLYVKIYVPITRIMYFSEIGYFHWMSFRDFACQCISVQFSRSVVSNSLRPHELQHARPPCPSPTPGVHSNSCPLSQWCHPAISSSGVPFSSCPQSLSASESFPMSQLFAWGDQSTGVSALASLHWDSIKKKKLAT